MFDLIVLNGDVTVHHCLLRGGEPFWVRPLFEATRSVRARLNPTGQTSSGRSPRVWPDRVMCDVAIHLSLLVRPLFMTTRPSELV